MSGKLHILHGPIRTGKTTSLLKWSEARSDVSGILTPDRGPHRWMLRLSDQSWHPFEVTGEATDIISVGKFQFHADAFRSAKQEIREAMEARSPWIVVDEVGKLEMRGKGLEPVVTELIHAHQSGAFVGNVLLVIREELLDPALEKWNIQEWETFSAIS